MQFFMRAHRFRKSWPLAAASEIPCASIALLLHKQRHSLRFLRQIELRTDEQTVCTQQLCPEGGACDPVGVHRSRFARMCGKRELLQTLQRRKIRKTLPRPEPVCRISRKT